MASKRKMFPFDDVIMKDPIIRTYVLIWISKFQSHHLRHWVNTVETYSCNPKEVFMYQDGHPLVQTPICPYWIYLHRGTLVMGCCLNTQYMSWIIDEVYFFQVYCACVSTDSIHVLEKKNHHSGKHDDVIKWGHLRVTGPLWGNLPVINGFPLTKASNAELRCLFYVRMNKRMSKQSIMIEAAGFQTTLKPLKNNW